MSLLSEDEIDTQAQTSDRWIKDIKTEEEASREWKSPTDVNLFKLFRDVFEINISQTNEDLFFTNLACCYRKNKTSGKASDTWFYLCTQKYMGELIEIIQPNVIITLGEKVFNSLGYCENATIKLIETTSLKTPNKMQFSDYVSECRFELCFDDERIKSIPIFPVFHTGSYSNKNRPYDKQVKDWERIKEYATLT